MIGLLQRVRSASVDVDDKRVAAIGPGLLVLVGIQKTDGERQAKRLLERLLSYRIFDDVRGRMNTSLVDHNGQLLLVPQFTLAADTETGTRPGFSKAAEPLSAKPLFDKLVAMAQQSWPGTQAGIFGARMRVALENDGPVTFWLETRR